MRWDRIVTCLTDFNAVLADWDCDADAPTDSMQGTVQIPPSPPPWIAKSEAEKRLQPKSLSLANHLAGKMSRISDDASCIQRDTRRARTGMGMPLSLSDRSNRYE